MYRASLILEMPALRDQVLSIIKSYKLQDILVAVHFDFVLDTFTTFPPPVGRYQSISMAMDDISIQDKFLGLDENTLKTEIEKLLHAAITFSPRSHERTPLGLDEDTLLKTKDLDENTLNVILTELKESLDAAMISPSNEWKHLSHTNMEFISVIQSLLSAWRRANRQSLQQPTGETRQNIMTEDLKKYLDKPESDKTHNFIKNMSIGCLVTALFSLSDTETLTKQKISECMAYQSGLLQIGYNPDYIKTIAAALFGNVTAPMCTKIDKKTGKLCRTDYTCKYLVKAKRCIGDTEIPLPKTNINIKCSDKYVIYLIGCNSCPAIYVGKTETDLNTRFTTHRTRIRDKAQGAIYEHFNLPDHNGLDDVWIQGIDKVVTHDENGQAKLTKKESDAELAKKESYWIWRLGSHCTEYGLNINVDSPPNDQNGDWIYKRGHCTFKRISMAAQEQEQENNLCGALQRLNSSSD